MRATFLGILIGLASVARYPVLEHLPQFKYAIFAFGVAASLLVWNIRNRIIKANPILFALYLLLLLKFGYGFLVANIQFNQGFMDSFLEARFSIMVLFVPIWARYFSHCTNEQLQLIIIGSVVCSLFVYISAFYFNVEMLELGERRIERIHVSAFPQIFLLLLLFCKTGSIRFSLLIIFIGMITSFLLSTSRLELLFWSVLLSVFIAARLRMSGLSRYGMLGGCAVLLLVFFYLLIDPIKFENRDLSIVYDVLSKYGTLGVGYLRDTNVASILNNEVSGFWLSDYGAFTYLMRYGFLYSLLAFFGWVMFYFTLSSSSQRLFFAFSTCAFLVVPLMEYFGLAAAISIGAIISLSKQNESH